MCFVFAVEFTG